MINSDSEDEKKKYYQETNILEGVQKYYFDGQSIHSKIKDNSLNFENQFKINNLIGHQSQKLQQFLNQHSDKFQLSQYNPYEFDIELIIKTKQIKNQLNEKNSFRKIIKAKNYETKQLCVIKAILFNDEELIDILQEFIIQKELTDISNQYFLDLKNKVLINFQKNIILAELNVAECSLQEYIKNNIISYEEYQQIAIQLINGLCLLHINKYAHRDIKPANILKVNNQWVYSNFDFTKKYTEQINIDTIIGNRFYLSKQIREQLNRQVFITKVDLLEQDKYALKLTLAQILFQHVDLLQIQQYIDNHQYNDRFILLLDKELLQIEGYFQEINNNLRNKKKKENQIVHNQLNYGTNLRIFFNQLMHHNNKQKYFMAKKIETAFNHIKNTDFFQLTSLLNNFDILEYKFIDIDKYINNKLSLQICERIMSLIIKNNLFYCGVKFLNEISKFYCFEHNQTFKEYFQFLLHLQVNYGIKLNVNIKIKKLTFQQILYVRYVKYKYIVHYQCYVKENKQVNQSLEALFKVDQIQGDEFNKIALQICVNNIPNSNTFEFIFINLYLSFYYLEKKKFHKSTQFFDKIFFFLIEKLQPRILNTLLISFYTFIYKLYYLDSTFFNQFIIKLEKTLNEQLSKEKLLIFQILILIVQKRNNEFIKLFEQLINNSIHLPNMILILIGINYKEINNSTENYKLNIYNKDYQSQDQIFTISNLDDKLVYLEFLIRNNPFSINLLTKFNQMFVFNLIQKIINFSNKNSRITMKQFIEKDKQEIQQQETIKNIQFIFNSIINCLPNEYSNYLLTSLGISWYESILNDEINQYDMEILIQKIVLDFNNSNQTQTFDLNVQLIFLLIEIIIHWKNNNIYLQVVRKLQNILLKKYIKKKDLYLIGIIQSIQIIKNLLQSNQIITNNQLIQQCNKEIQLRQMNQNIIIKKNLQNYSQKQMKLLQHHQEQQLIFMLKLDLLFNIIVKIQLIYQPIYFNQHEFKSSDKQSLVKYL